MTYLYGLGLVALGFVGLCLFVCILNALAYKFIACIVGLVATILVFAPLAAGTALQHHPVPYWIRLGLCVSLTMTVCGFLFSAAFADD